MKRHRLPIAASLCCSLMLVALACSEPQMMQIPERERSWRDIDRVTDSSAYADHLQNFRFRDTLPVHDVLLNDHSLRMSLDQFKALERADSSHREQWFCDSPLANDEDEPWITTRWCKNRQYISDDDEALVLSFEMAGNTLTVPSRGISFTENTTWGEFKQLFPFPARYAELTRTKDNSQLDGDVLFKFPFDDHWIFHFENGLLVSVQLWWLLC